MDRRRFLKIVSLLSLLPLLESGRRVGATPERRRQSQDGPNVLILLLDTLSARNMSLYGYRRQTTPNLERFAERATVYHAHRSAGNFTTPSTASLLTGTYPWTHRAFNMGGLVARDQVQRNLLKPWRPSHNRLLYAQASFADLLLNQFEHDGDVRLARQEFCFADFSFPTQLLANDADIADRSFTHLLFHGRGFPGASLYLSLADRLNVMTYEGSVLSRYADLYPRGMPRLVLHNAYFLLEQVMDGLMALLSTTRQPFIAYFHLYPPHQPYRPRSEFLGIFDDNWTPVTKETHPLSDGAPQEKLNQWRVEYDEYVAYADAEFGRFYDFLQETGILDSSYVVLTSDHGQLFERGVHGHATALLYEPVIHVPLLISRPSQKQRQDVHLPTSCVDVMPSLLHATGLPIPNWCEGEFLPAFGRAQGSSERSLFSVEAKGNPAYRPLGTGTIALIRGQYKLIHYFGHDGYENEYELYDLTNDPEEMENLYPIWKSIAADLRHELQMKLREVNEPYTK